MKQDWQNVSARKGFANALQEIDITISNHNGFLVNERPFCSVEPLELGYAKWTRSSGFRAGVRGMEEVSRSRCIWARVKEGTVSR